MAVSIKANFSLQHIHKMMQDRVDRIYAVILNRLVYVGEKCVRNCRSVGAYTDQTGNLRNSIGYVVLHDGKVIKENFERAARVVKTTKSGKKRTTKGGKDGLQKAQSLIKEIQSEYPKGFVLIVVAGMEYAAAVEAKGYDVITSSTQEAILDLKRAMAEIKSKIDKIK